MEKETNETTYHIPALLKETIEGLNIRPGGVYADATFGGGGHSRAIVNQLDSEGHLYSFDQDRDSLVNVINDPRFTFVLSNFRYIKNFLRFHGEEKIDGIIADLGVSFHHFDDPSRGFSFRSDAPLDMRMNRNAETTAADIIAGYDTGELTAMFRRYTDLKRPHEVARLIASAREKSPILTTFQLVEAVRPAANQRNEKKDLAQIFQAIRIEVNHEMDALRQFLESTLEVLRPGGRLCVLTYHSVEDRMVKNFMKTGNVEGIEEKDFFGKVSTPWKQITRSPLTAGADEVERNPRSRSAKLRIAELLIPDKDSK